MNLKIDNFPNEENLIPQYLLSFKTYFKDEMQYLSICSKNFNKEFIKLNCFVLFKLCKKRDQSPQFKFTNHYNLKFLISYSFMYEIKEILLLCIEHIENHHVQC